VRQWQETISGRGVFTRLPQGRAVRSPEESLLRVREALVDLLPGRTRVIASQKMDAVRRADGIVVLEQGRVVEEGRHDDLPARGGFHAEAHRLQGLSLIC
jgi:ABC-type multidrug transport system fused ATPase/permease subunit